MELKTIPTNSITPNTWNPNYMKSELITALSTQIKKKGFLQQILVSRIEGTEEYTIIDGEHRWSEAMQQGLENMEVVVLEDVEIEDMKALTLSMNMLRGTFEQEKLDLLIKEFLKEHSLLEIAENSGLSFTKIKSANIRIDGRMHPIKEKIRALPSEFCFAVTEEEMFLIDEQMNTLQTLLKVSSEDEVYEQVILLTYKLLSNKLIAWDKNTQKLKLVQEQTPQEQTLPQE